MDAWAQQSCVDMLTRYCRLFFACPDRRPAGPDATEAPTPLPEDLALFLKSLRLLLHSSSKGVTLAAVVALCYLAPAGDLKVVTAPMLRCIRQAPPESARALLLALMPIVESRPELLRSSVREFFVYSFDFVDVKKFKLKILEFLVDDTNVQLVLRELQAYVSWQSDPKFVALAVQTIAHVALKITSVADSCLRGLVKMLDSKCEALSCEAVVALRALLQRRRETSDSGLGAVLPHLAHHLEELKAPTARASVVWIISQYQREAPRLAPDVIRKLVKGFPAERAEVKQQILALALKVWAFHSLNARGEIPVDDGAAAEQAASSQPAMAPEESAKVLPRLAAIVDHLSDLAALDAAWDVRDTARVLRKLRDAAQAGLASGATAGLPALGSWYCKACVGLCSAALPGAVGAAAAGSVANEAADTIPSPWALGSLAQALDFPLDSYRPLPHWAEANSSDDLRKPKVELAPKHEAAKSLSSSNVGNVQHIENRVQAPSNIKNMPVPQSLEDLDLFYSNDAPSVPSRGPAGGGCMAKGAGRAAAPMPEQPRQTLEEFSLAAPRPPPAVVGTAVFGEDDESDEDEESDDGQGNDDDDWKYCAQASSQAPSAPSEPPTAAAPSVEQAPSPAEQAPAPAPVPAAAPAPVETPAATSVAAELAPSLDPLPRSPTNVLAPVVALVVPAAVEEAGPPATAEAADVAEAATGAAAQDPAASLGDAAAEAAAGPPAEATPPPAAETVDDLLL